MIYLARLPHRDRAAFRAIAERREAVSFAARALPPFNPPSRPSATAAGFFSDATSPTMREAMRFTSLLERLGIAPNSTIARCVQRFFTFARLALKRGPSSCQDSSTH